jgi:predicted AlkP superfamily pyrophosphatase or phosphodiesterase
VVIADEGWALSSRERFRPVPASESIKFRGGHGFDNQLESMRAIFIGHGPAFKKGQVVEPFANVDVYNVMAKILKLKPAPNDGNKATIKTLLR